jgi:hypothetical protein
MPEDKTSPGFASSKFHFMFLKLGFLSAVISNILVREYLTFIV